MIDPIFGVPKVWRVDMPCEAELGGGKFFFFWWPTKRGGSNKNHKQWLFFLSC